MNSVLIVSASPRAASRMEEWLGTGCEATVAASEAEARSLLGGKRFDALIVNAPLSDGSGEALCLRADVDALLLVPQAGYEAARARMEARGVLTLPKPVAPALFQQAMSLLFATHAKLSRLQGKLEEVRIVERAKRAMMQYLKMNEAEAHRYIEKQAMDLRQTKREVAEAIIKTYEN